MLKQMRILIAACLLVCMGATTVSAATARIFTFEGGLDEQGFGYSGYNNNFTVSNGVLVMTVEQPDVAGGTPILAFPDNLGISADENKYVSITIKNTSAINKAQLYFATTTEPAMDENKSLVIEIGTNMADFQTYTFDFSQHAQWKGTLKSLRLDSITGTGIEKDMKVFLKSVAIASTLEPAEGGNGEEPIEQPSSGGPVYNNPGAYIYGKVVAVKKPDPIALDEINLKLEEIVPNLLLSTVLLNNSLQQLTEIYARINQTAIPAIDDANQTVTQIICLLTTKDAAGCGL